jgi:penicillin-binding protein 1A
MFRMGQASDSTTHAESHPTAMTTPPPRPSRTFLGSLSRVAQQTKINFSKLRLKPNAKVPELWVQNATDPQATIYPLLGDRYIIGRSSQSDICIANPVVSQTHLSIHRDSRKNGWLPNPFFIQDEQSTNGIYRGKTRVTAAELRHKAVYTLGPPDLEGCVRLQYIDPPPWYVKTFRYGFFGATGVAAIATLAVLLEWQKFSVTPLPTSVQGPVVVYAGDEQTLLKPQSNRPHVELKTLREFSPYLPKALLASEDSRFYWHLGVDPIGIGRALMTNLMGGEIREGASTITQQLARNMFPRYVRTGDTAGRKLREMIVALKLETVYSKDLILLTYLNRVYLGVSVYGFEDAAQFYFGKSAKDLDLSEAATLAGILPGPNQFNPVTNYTKALRQRDGVLERMVQLGMVTPEQANLARRSRLQINPKAKEELSKSRAPYYYSYVFDELQQLLGSDLANEGNFIIYTGLNLDTQAKAEAALRNGVATEGSRHGFSQGAIVTLDSRNGEVQAIAGGVDYQASQFNRAQAERQPGSTFKIFAYTAALERQISPSTAFSCAPLTWEGQTFEGCGGGSLDMYSGVARSENVIALRVAQDVGLDAVVGMARRMGVTSKLKAVPGLVLGQSETTPLEMTGAFSVLANRGLLNPPRAIRRVLDGGNCKNRNDLSSCRLMYSTEQDTERNRPVLQPEVADTMTTLLQGVVSGGTGRAAAIAPGIAGKTGTTNNGVDLWFIGYVPGGLVTGIWLGNDMNESTSGQGAVAAGIWGRYMAQVLR